MPWWMCRGCARRRSRTPTRCGAGDTLYLAGQVAFDADGEVVGSTVAEQARQVWDNIASVLAASGSSIADVVKITYFMQDVREIAEEIEVRREVFAGRPVPGRHRVPGRQPSACPASRWR